MWRYPRGASEDDRLVPAQRACNGIDGGRDVVLLTEEDGLPPQLIGALALCSSRLC
jgi:hypothetical protein